jgi:hypothetical protein
MEQLTPEQFDEELETGAHENVAPPIDEPPVDGTLLIDLDAEETNEEKNEREKNELLLRLVANNIVYLKDRVAFILNTSVEARNSDIDLAWMYWQTYQSERFDGTHITRDQMMKLTRLSSIARERARIQNQYKLFQADPEVKRFRYIREGDFKQAAIDEKPEGHGFYHVYIDETGKTDPFLSIGSLWILKHGGASDVLKIFEINKWKKDNEITSEFHFSKVTKHKVASYKIFFEKFLSLFPQVSFKLITLNRQGISNQNQAIVDLTYHLLDKGVRHEDETGRAPLPRRLQVTLDEEEKGSDRLKLENIKERLNRQKMEGLRLGLFEVASSSGNYFIQIVDLFTGAVNRKLNNPNGDSFKDELADHILELVGLDISSIDRENTSTDQSHVFNLLDKPFGEQTEPEA